MGGHLQGFPKKLRVLCPEPPAAPKHSARRSAESVSDAWLSLPAANHLTSSAVVLRRQLPVRNATV
jgi:hypothetical protein